MPSNEKIVKTILVIIIVSLSIYNYTTIMATQPALRAEVKRREANEAALMAEVNRREAAEVALAKRETYIQHLFKGLDDAGKRGELNQQAKLAIQQSRQAAVDAASRGG